MSTLNGAQLLEVIGNVDDELVAESLAVFCLVAEGGAPVFVPAPKAPRRALGALLAAGLAAAMLCGAVTVVPLLGGPDLWRGFYGVIAPLLSPDTTDTAEEESASEPKGEAEDTAEEETRRDHTVIDPDDDWNGGAVQYPPTVPTPNTPSVPDPSPNLPGFNWNYDIPNTPPGPTYTPGPGPVRNPNLGG